MSNFHKSRRLRLGKSSSSASQPMFHIFKPKLDNKQNRGSAMESFRNVRNFFRHLFIIAKTVVLTIKDIGKEACRSIKSLTDPVDRKGQYAIITGGNRGIGYYTLQGLVASGMKVIAGCRDGNSKKQLFDRLEKAGISNESVEWINLDMSSMDSIKNFAQSVLEKNVPIHLLINNAGIMFTPHVLTKDGFEQQFAVNYLGHFLLTHLLLPKIVNQTGQDSRIVNVSSSLAFLVGSWFSIDDLHQAKSFYNKWTAYSQSKLAQIMFTETLQARLIQSDSSVKCYALHPGTIRSNWYKNDWASRIFIRLFGFMFKSEADGARRVLYIAFSKKLEHLSGIFLDNCEVVQTFTSPNLREKLWNVSCELLNIRNFGGL